jgi:hypothetical protein
MGDTLEGQKKKAPKRKKQVVVRGGSYSSSESLGKAFDQRLPSAVAATQARQGVFGRGSPRAAIMDAVSSLVDMTRDKEGKTGSRLAEKVAAEVVKQNRPDKNLKELLNRNDGGMAEKTRVF